jgi:hypothetical protein
MSSTLIERKLSSLYDLSSDHGEISLDLFSVCDA